MKAPELSSKKHFIFYHTIIMAAALCAGAASIVLADMIPPSPSPYSFGPEGNLMEDVQQYGKPNEMVSFLPNRPVAARDKYGNRLYYSTNGKLLLKISTDGKQEYYLDLNSKEIDKEGTLIKETSKVEGSNLLVTKNAKGEVMGYQELGYGDKVIKEYDQDMNLTKSYAYDRYAKNVDSVLDELSQSKTTFDRKGQAVNDKDFEGNVVATYFYDDKGRMSSKVDATGNKTTFDKAGNMLHTEDMNGNIMLNYTYTKDQNGYTELVRADNTRTLETTYFKGGRQQYTTNSQGTLSKEYHWDGWKLTFSFEHGADETTFYDVNGKELYTTHNENLMREWVYYKGRLMGFYDADSQTTVIYQFQREDVRMHTETKPDGKEIQRWYDEGIIDDLRLHPR